MTARSMRHVRKQSRKHGLVPRQTTTDKKVLIGMEPNKVSSTGSRMLNPSDNYENSTIYNNLGLIQTMIVSDLWSDDSARVEQGLKSLADLCTDSLTADQHRTAIYSAHGASAMLGAMKRWFAVPEIQAAACRAVCNSGSNSAQFRETANALGAIRMIVAAMQHYPEDEGVQRCGCSALFCVMWVRENEIYDSDRIQAVHVIVKATKSYPLEVDLQICACAAIKGLSQWQKFRVPIVEAGGLVALATLIETFRKDPSDDVQRTVKRARSALKELA